MMTFKESPNLVIAGIWNLGILTPQWYAKEFPDLIKQKEFSTEIQIGIGALRFTVENIIINPTPDKLIFFSKSSESAQYELIEKLALGTITKLPHTPITALGHNISYFSNGEKFRLFESGILDKNEEFYKKEVAVIALNSQSVKHSLSYENYSLNLTYDFNRKKNFVSFNYHYEVSNIDKIKECILDFRKNINHSETIMQKITGGK